MSLILEEFFVTKCNFVRKNLPNIGCWGDGGQWGDGAEKINRILGGRESEELLHWRLLPSYWELDSKLSTCF